jgi:predicted neutral ceramidase superfamily lipid hydrolase
MPRGRIREKGTTTIPRPGLQNLSDLIFGLALSIGALVLLGQTLTSFSQIIVSLAFFAFGFYLLVSVWYRYSSVMKVLPFETSRLGVLEFGHAVSRGNRTLPAQSHDHLEVRK